MHAQQQQLAHVHAQAYVTWWYLAAYKILGQPTTQTLSVVLDWDCLHLKLGGKATLAMGKGTASGAASAAGVIKSILSRCFAPLPPLGFEGDHSQHACALPPIKVQTPPCTALPPTPATAGHPQQPSAPAANPVELLLFPAGPGSMSIKVSIVPAKASGPQLVECTPGATPVEGSLDSAHSTIGSPVDSSESDDMCQGKCQPPADAGAAGPFMPDKTLMLSCSGASGTASFSDGSSTAIEVDSDSPRSCNGPLMSNVSAADQACSSVSDKGTDIAAVGPVEQQQQQETQQELEAAVPQQIPAVQIPADCPPTPKQTAMAAPIQLWLEDLQGSCQQLSTVLGTLSEAYFKVRSRHPDVGLFHLTCPADRHLALSSPWMARYSPTCSLTDPVLMVLSAWTGTGAASSAQAQPLADTLQAHMPDVWIQVQPVAEAASFIPTRSEHPSATPYGVSGPRSGDLDARLVLPDLAQLLLGNPLRAVNRSLCSVSTQLSDAISWWNSHYSDLSRQPLLQLASVIDSASTQLDATKEKLQACLQDIQIVELNLKRELVYAPQPNNRKAKRSMLSRSLTTI